jgi:hypothetical protein
VDADTFRVRSVQTSSRRFRRPYQSSYGSAIPFSVGGTALPYFLAYPDVIGDGDSQQPQNSAAEGYAKQPEFQASPAASSVPSQISSVTTVIAPTAQSRPSADSDSDDAITLIFKDGRPPELIHNYILTRKTLYVGERHHPEIPVDQLDLIATAQVNHDAGIDFHLPDARK